MGVSILHGVVQHYEWGGSEWLPEILSKIPDGQPWAEYWLGTHPKGTASLDMQVPLTKYLLANSEQALGRKTLERFGELPFLFKLLDVRKMLSIQLHPSKQRAEEGFAREQAAGIPADAPHRNYKDRNHKPEVMLALTDFWLLHGFRPLEQIRETLQLTPGWELLLPLLQSGGLPALYRHVMSLPQEEVAALLAPLKAQLDDQGPSHNRDEPAYWAAQAFEDYGFDRGIFSIYWLNLVKLVPGEAIFQAAGIPHAYLYGRNVELMANSDNVLRGGLTPKHIDVDELLANIDFSPVLPQIDPGAYGFLDEVYFYPVRIADFGLASLYLQPGNRWQGQLPGAAMMILLNDAQLNINGQSYTRGQACWIDNGTALTLENKGESTAELYVAYVPN